MGAVGRMEIGTEGMTKTDAVNTAEAGAEDSAGMGVVGTAGVAAASPSPSKGSANERNGHTDKRGRVNLAKKKKKGGGRKDNTYP